MEGRVTEKPEMQVSIAPPGSAPKQTTSAPVESKPRRSLLPWMLLFLLIPLGWFVYRELFHRAVLPEGLVQANGRIEGDTISVASKFAGRIAKVTVKEGDQVQQGQVLVELEDDQVRARVDQARQAVDAAESQLRAARTALEVSRREVPLSIATAQAGVEHAQAALTRAEAAEQQAGRDAQRFSRLAARGTVGKQRAEQAELAQTAAHSDREAARTGYQQSIQQLELARLGWDRTRSAADRVQALGAQANQAKAALADAESVQTDLAVRSPIAGVVTAKIRDVGEVVAAGAPIYELVNLNQLYLKVYVAENQIGKLRLGLPAQVYTDAFPDQAFPAKVGYIADRAEFTPKEVQTPDERIKLVFAVKLYFSANPQHQLTPGIPADAVIRWKEQAPWSKPVR